MSLSYQAIMYMRDCCRQVLQPDLFWYERGKSYTFSCPACGVMQTARGKARTARVGDARWDALARQQGLVWNVR